MTSENQDKKVLQVKNLKEKFFNLLSISATDKIVQIKLALMLCDNDFEKALDLINQMTDHVVNSEQDAIKKMTETMFKRL